MPTETHSRDIEVLALDAALDKLAGLNDRKSHVVELRCFGGLSIEETPLMLGVSPESEARLEDR